MCRAQSGHRSEARRLERMRNPERSDGEAGPPFNSKKGVICGFFRYILVISFVFYYY